MAQQAEHYQLKWTAWSCPAPCWFWFRIILHAVLGWSTHSQTPAVISNHRGKWQHTPPVQYHAFSTYLCLDNLGGEFTHCIHQPPFQTLGKITNRLCKCACKESCRVRRAVPHCLYTHTTFLDHLLGKAQPLIWQLWSQFSILGQLGPKTHSNSSLASLWPILAFSNCWDMLFKDTCLHQHTDWQKQISGTRFLQHCSAQFVAKL